MAEARCTEECTLWLVGHCLICKRREECANRHKVRRVFGGTANSAANLRGVVG